MDAPETRPWRVNTDTTPPNQAVLLLPGFRPLLIPCPLQQAQAELALMTPERLRECLADLRWSQRELARALGIDEASVRKWARGAVPIPATIEPWLESLAAVHAALPAPVGWKSGRLKNS